MKLSELRPCDGCGGVLMPPSAGMFYVVDLQGAILDRAALMQVDGIGRIWGKSVMEDPRVLRIAETFAPLGDQAVQLLGEHRPELKSRLLLCMNCATPTALIAERRNDKAAAETSRLGEANLG